MNISQYLLFLDIDHTHKKYFEFLLSILLLSLVHSLTRYFTHLKIKVPSNEIENNFISFGY